VWPARGAAKYGGGFNDGATVTLTIAKAYQLLATRGIYAREACDRRGQVLGAVRFMRRGDAERRVGKKEIRN
jgi:hypothetical protein